MARRYRRACVVGVLRVYAHYTFLSAQIAEVEAERQAQLQASADTHIDKVRQLMLLKGIGINGAWLLVMEFFGWRTFKNRREVGGLRALRRHHIKAAKVRGNKGSPSRQPARALDDHGVGLELAPPAGQRPSVWFRARFGSGASACDGLGLWLWPASYSLRSGACSRPGDPRGAVLKEV